MAAKKKQAKKPQISVPGGGMLAKTIRKINKRKIANEPKKVKKAPVKKSTISQGDTTAKNPSTIKKKTSAQAAAEKAAIKRRIAAKIKPKSKKITSTKKTSKKKPS